MGKRYDGWTEEQDRIVIDGIIDGISEGKSQLRCFEEIGERIKRSPAAVGFRWNKVLRHEHNKKVAESKMQQRQKRGLNSQTQRVSIKVSQLDRIEESMKEILELLIMRV